jgi:enoyl-[acyl-carrier protein] reductase III
MNDKWGIIIGGSTGIGLAVARKMAEEGFNLIIVHRNRRSEMPAIDAGFDAISEKGVGLHTLNMNALDKETFGKIASLLSTLSLQGKLHFYLHSVAMGNIGYLKGKNALTTDDLISTIHAMGVNFYEWGKWLLEGGWFTKNASLIGLTSEGNKKVSPGYVAVGAAKSVLEILCKYMAVEFAENDVRVNVVQAGITDTNALGVLSNRTEIIESAKKKNPFNRITIPEDVANAVYLLVRPEAKWINGTILRVDGGEQISG